MTDDEAESSTVSCSRRKTSVNILTSFSYRCRGTLRAVSATAEDTVCHSSRDGLDPNDSQTELKQFCWGRGTGGQTHSDHQYTADDFQPLQVLKAS